MLQGGPARPEGAMSRRAARITQADVARALKALAQTGVRAALEICADGVLRIVPLEPAPIAEAPPSAPTPPVITLGNRVM
jgi:hypothetical protein